MKDHSMQARSSKAGDTVITVLATCGFTGMIPVMPGTFGTLWGVAIAYLAWGWPVYIQAAIIIAVFVGSVFVSSGAERIFHEKDPSRVVCDEVSGVLVAFFLIPFTTFNAILVFILFRFFDILKPYPIRAIERGFKGGRGVVLDDVAAGIFANIAAHLIIWIAG